MPPRASGAGRKPGSNLPAAVPDDQLLKKVPKAPDELMDDNSCLIWKSQARVLIDRKVLTEDLLPLLLAYCNSFSIMLKADAMILKDGLIALKLDSLPDTKGKTVDLTVKWNSFSGGKTAIFKYRSRQTAK